MEGRERDGLPNLCDDVYDVARGAVRREGADRTVADRGDLNQLATENARTEASRRPSELSQSERLLQVVLG
jgi:hypothetical protein